jgi:hypothetical protein
MKSKLLVILSTLVMAVVLMAQTATQTTPAPSGDTKTCACCNHDKADGKMACCGKDGGCCKDGKCDMMSKDGKDAMTHEHMMSGDDKAANKCPMMTKDGNGKMSCCGKDDGCCKDGKCDMAKDGKSCCDGKQCARPPAGA